MPDIIKWISERKGKNEGQNKKQRQNKQTNKKQNKKKKKISSEKLSISTIIESEIIFLKTKKHHRDFFNDQNISERK